MIHHNLTILEGAIIKVEQCFSNTVSLSQENKSNPILRKINLNRNGFILTPKTTVHIQVGFDYDYCAYHLNDVKPSKAVRESNLILNNFYVDEGKTFVTVTNMNSSNSVRLEPGEVLGSIMM